MLAILRNQDPQSSYYDANITLRDGNNNVSGKPDISFTIHTYNKISKDDPKSPGLGEQILLPLNMFLNTLTFVEQTSLYEMFRFTKQAIAAMTQENRRETQDLIQKQIFNTIDQLRLAPKLIDFCQTEPFIYPDLSSIGQGAHHTADKTYVLHDYVEITAIILLTKLMVPIWGEFIYKIKQFKLDDNRIEKFALDLFEPILDHGAFERIYNKLYRSLVNLVTNRRNQYDGKSQANGVSSTFILTRNGMDDEMFNSIVMATIVVKRMGNFECFNMRPVAGASEGSNSAFSPPDVMVYIDDSIKRRVETAIENMRKPMNTMPRKELPRHDTDDNSSIIDHSSKTSKKPIDVPIFIVTAVEEWEIPKLLAETQTPLDVFESAIQYYQFHPFEVSPLCQAMVASFIGTRFGGSKCLNYLPPVLYQQVVTMVQIYLAKQGLIDLMSLITSITSPEPVEGVYGSLPARLDANLKSDEYTMVEALYKGWHTKPMPHFNRKNKNKMDTERIDFTNHIAKMKDWMVRYTHQLNVAPDIWLLANTPDIPVNGTQVVFDEHIIRHLCRFYLQFHGTQRPF